MKNRTLLKILLSAAAVSAVACAPKDTEAPAITVNNKVVTVGTEVKKKSLYTVTDNMDENPKVKVKGDIDTSVEGMYKLTVEAEDKAGNKSSKEVKIVVKGESSSKGSSSAGTEAEDAEKTEGSEASSAPQSSSQSGSSSSQTASSSSQRGNVEVVATGGTGASRYAPVKDSREADSAALSSTKTAETDDEVSAFVDSVKQDPSQFLTSGSSMLNDGYADHTVVNANGHSSSETWNFVNSYFASSAAEEDIETYGLYYYTNGKDYGYRDFGDEDHFLGIVVCGKSSIPDKVQ